MAKKKPDHNITAEDLKEYLTTRDDFALELFVYHEANKLGFQATHGGTYVDPVTSKHRQYDIRAAFERRGCRVDLAIECKSLQTTYPLLLSRIPRAQVESFHQLISYDRARERGADNSITGSLRLRPVGFTTASHERVDPTVPLAKAVRVSGKQSIYPADAFVGKALTQVRRDEQEQLKSGDEVFDKWSQALASVDELVARAEGGYGAASLLTFVIPVLVVRTEHCGSPTIPRADMFGSS